jgi:hypothetical protein
MISLVNTPIGHFVIEMKIAYAAARRHSVDRPSYAL